MIIPIATLALSIFLLFIAGEITVRGAISIASRLKIPPLVIGLTLLSIGTSLPELFVSITASLNQQYSLVLGNIIGSNIANTLLILGIALAFTPLYAQDKVIRFNALASLIAAFALLFFIFDHHLSRFEAISLLIAALAVIILNFRSSPPPLEDDITSPLALPLALFLLTIGLILLPWSSSLLIDSATLIARTLNVSEAVIGLTAVALGTSLPELVTTLTALIRKHHALSLGNIIGSNLFNILIVTGAAATLQPFFFDPTPLLNGFLLMIAILAIPLLHPLFSKKMHRISGITMIIAYFVTITLLAL